MALPTRDRLRLSYEELIGRALAEHSLEKLQELLTALIQAYYPGGDAERPRSGADIMASVGSLVAPFHPDTLGYVPEGLVRAIGEELVIWLEEGLRRPPTTTDIAKLYSRLGKLGIREAIHQSCLTWNPGEAAGPAGQAGEP